MKKLFLLILFPTILLADPLGGIRPQKLGIKTHNGFVIVKIAQLAEGEKAIAWGKCVPTEEQKLFWDQMELEKKTEVSVATTVKDGKTVAYEQNDAIADWNKIVSVLQAGQKPTGKEDEQALILWKAIKKLFVKEAGK